MVSIASQVYQQMVKNWDDVFSFEDRTFQGGAESIAAEDSNWLIRSEFMPALKATECIGKACKTLMVIDMILTF
jgi:hypothetical protein